MTTSIIGVISDDQTFAATFDAAISQLAEDCDYRCYHNTDYSVDPSTTAACDALAAVASRAGKFLRGQKKPLSLVLVTAKTAVELAELLESEGFEEATLGLLAVDARHENGEGNYSGAGHLEWFEAIYRALDERDARYCRSSYSDLAFIDKSSWFESPYQNSIDYQIKCWDEEPWVNQAEILFNLSNYLQHTLLNKFAQRRLRTESKPIPLGHHLVDFMRSQHNADWLVSCYTGSVVSSIIKQIESDAEELGALCLRGPNEHSMLVVRLLTGGCSLEVICS